MGKQSSDVLLLKIDGELKDLDRKSEYSEESPVEEIDSQSEEILDVYRYPYAHLLAHAVKELFPDSHTYCTPSHRENEINYSSQRV